MSKELEPLSFRFSGRVAKLLGRESVSNAIVALSELVKNAYDADSTKVEVIFENTTTAQGRIRVRDDGVAMTYDDFKNKWMVVGTDTKERTTHSPSGKRRVVGEKGIGRFSVERLAEKVTLVSNPKDRNDTITLHIDWSQYAKNGAIFDEVKNKVTSSPKKKKTEQGLEIILENLRDKWTADEVEELEKQLSMLIPPGQIKGFEIQVYAPEYKKYGIKIESKLLREAMYEFTSSLKKDRIHYVIRKDGRIVHDDSIKTESIECGPIKFEMYFFPLDRKDEKWTYKVFKLREITSMLKEFGGLKIYRDGFRVKPYGDPGDDWLGLNFKRLQRFGRKMPSNNQIVGFVYISRDANESLLDTTTREGLIHNMAYHHMTDFLNKSITAFSQFRQEAEKEVTKKDKPKTEINDNIDRLKKIVETSDMKAEHRKAVEEIIADVATEVTRVEQESISTMQVYRNLAALGITVSSISHEIAAPIAIIMHTSTGLIRDLESEKIDRKELTSNLETIRSNSVKVQEFVQYILGFASATSKKKTNLDVGEVFNLVISPFRRVLEKRGIEVIANINPGLSPIFMNRAELDSILVNLLTNATYFLKTTPKPVIKFTANSETNGFNFTFSDNGQGVPPENRKIIFEPFFTTKKGGVGLGLTIVKEIIEDNGGSIEIIESEFGTGTTFKVFLPKKVNGTGTK